MSSKVKMNLGDFARPNRSSPDLRFAMRLPRERIVALLFKDGVVRRHEERQLSLIDAPVRSAMTKDVKTIEATKTLGDGIKIMRDANIGCLVVMGKDKTPVGIFTERDLVRRLAEKGHGVLGLTMAQTMNKPLTIISPVATIWDAITLMGRADIRRLPVVENGHIVGILTERDVLRLILAQQSLLLESVSESLPATTKEQVKGIVGRFGLERPPGRGGSET
jgi:CBS domain-containing protein